jgi:hypothetical protein
MQDEEYFAARLRLRQVLGRLKALHDDATLPVRVRWCMDDAIVATEKALRALREEPTRAAG